MIAIPVGVGLLRRAFVPQERLAPLSELNVNPTVTLSCSLTAPSMSLSGKLGRE